MARLLGAAALCSLLVLVALGTIGCSSSEETTRTERSAYVIGQVTLPTEQPVANAQVSTDPLMELAVTDEQGVFYMDNPLPNQEFAFVAEHRDFTEAGRTMPVQIRNGGVQDTVYIVLGQTRDALSQPMEVGERGNPEGTGGVRSEGGQ